MSVLSELIVSHKRGYRYVIESRDSKAVMTILRICPAFSLNVFLLLSVLKPICQKLSLTKEILDTAQIFQQNDR
jgi:hypothetical protein